MEKLEGVMLCLGLVALWFALVEYCKWYWEQREERVLEDQAGQTGQVGQVGQVGRHSSVAGLAQQVAGEVRASQAVRVGVPERIEVVRPEHGQELPGVLRPEFTAREWQGFEGNKAFWAIDNGASGETTQWLGTLDDRGSR